MENCFGRLCTFGLFGSKWRWAESKYQIFLKLGVALTNVHILWNPLRASDGSLYNTVSSRLIFIGESTKKKRASNQQESRGRRRAHLSEQLTATVNGNANAIV